MNDQGNTNQELRKRRMEVMTTWKIRNILETCKPPIIFKLRVYDAVVTTKLLYGLGSAQLTKVSQARMYVFQLRFKTHFKYDHNILTNGIRTRKNKRK